MKRKKLLNKLAEFLDMKGRKQRKHHDDLEVLLIKLEKKKADLEKELLSRKTGTNGNDWARNSILSRRSTRKGRRPCGNSRHCEGVGL